MEKVRFDKDAEIDLSHNWKYAYGDNTKWSEPGFDESSWLSVSDMDSVEWKKDTIWFRKRLVFQDSLIRQLAFKRYLNAENQLFIDGELIGPSVKDSSVLWNYLIPVPLCISPTGEHVIAVRLIKNNKSKEQGDIHFSTSGGPGIVITDYYKQLKKNVQIQIVITVFLTFIMSVFFVLGVFHLLLFVYYKEERSNLFLSLFCIACGFILVTISSFFIDPTFSDQPAIKAVMFFTPLVPVFLIGLMNTIFYPRLKRIFWICLVGITLFKTFKHFHVFNSAGTIANLFVFVAVIEIFREMIVAIRKRKPGSRIIGLGVLFTLISVVGLLYYLFKYLDEESEIAGIIILLLVVTVLLLSIPMTMSFHFASSFSKTNVKLKEQVKQVEDLSVKNLEQEREKKRILENQNLVLEQEVTARTAEVVQQKKVLEERNKDITDSINYAERIQHAILPSELEIKKALPDSFVLFMPKDIVSGDFYWFSNHEDACYIAAADCTGHGVPGAFMSMVGNTLLNDIVNQKNITQPALVLDSLHIGIKEVLRQNSSDAETKDGMDIAFCRYDKATLQLNFAGALRPLYIIRNGELIVVKPDKFCIGGYHVEEQRRFTNNIIQLQKNDVCYIFSDGYADQFGGDTGKKFMIKNFQKLLLEISDKTMEEQKSQLTEIHFNWKNTFEQVDDILVIGFKA